MPGAYRYSATLDKTYRDEEGGTNVQLSAANLNSRNGTHNRTCSMDSLDSISSSGGASLASSSCSGGAHSRQVSADSTSSPTNFSSSTSPSSYLGTRKTPSSTGKASHNPHQFIQAGPSTLHKSASEQIKVVKEVVKTFRSPVKEDEEEWQLNLSSWKSKRRNMSEKTIQRVDEFKSMEFNDSDAGKKKKKTFSQMCEDKARRPSYNLKIYSEYDEDSEKIFSDDNNSTKNEASCEDTVNKEKDSSCDESNDNDNANKDKDDGYSSKDECNKTEADDQSDTAAADDQVSMITESSGVSEREIAVSYSARELEAFPESSHDDDKIELASTASLTQSSEDDFSNTNYGFLEDVCETQPQTSVASHQQTAPNDQKSIRQESLMEEKPEALETIEHASNTIKKSLVLFLKPSSDVKDFGFSIKGDGLCGKVIVDNVTPHGAAEKGGLMSGDCIIAINGEQTAKRSHSALVFAVKQAVYTGQLQLNILRNWNQSDDSTVKSHTSVNENRAAFLQNETKVETERPSPSRDTVSRRRSMFDNLINNQTPKSVPNVDVRLSIRDRVASFETISDSPCQNFIKSEPSTPKITDNNSELEPLSSNSDLMSKESVLSCADLVETSIDSSGSDKDDDSNGGTNVKAEEKCDEIVENEDVCEIQESFVKTEVEVSEWEIEEVCNKLQMKQVSENDEVSVEHSIDDKLVTASDHVDDDEDNAPATAEPVEDVSDALDEALAVFDSPHRPPPMDSTPSATAQWVSSNNSKTFQEDDLNVIFDSSATSSNNNDVYYDDDFDRPRSIVEPPKEKPPPPPVDIEPLNQTPPMKRINSTKRIKKEMWRRRSDFLGLSDAQDDILDLDEKIPKPRRQIEDLLRSELELEKSLPSPTLSSQSSDEPVKTENDVEDVPDSEELQILADLEEEERIRQLEIQRIEMQEARKKTEEERLLQQRVEQIRKQQEMMNLEKERLRREQDEVMKARRSSLCSSNGDSSSNTETSVEQPPPNYVKNKQRPRAPPPPPPKPAVSQCPQPGQRSEVIRLSRRPTSGDYSAVDLGSVDPRSQPIQKQPLSRHSLQSLSAVPKANLNNTDLHWMKKDAAAVRRRSDVPRKDTYSHWLIQEAEMRRLSEQSERVRGDKRGKAGYPLSMSKSDTNIARSTDVITHDLPIDNYSHVPEANVARHWSNGNVSEMKSNYSPDRYTYEEVIAPPMHVPGVYSTNVHDVPSVMPSSGHMVNYNELNGHHMYSEQDLYADSGKATSAAKLHDNMLSVSGRKKCSSCSQELGRGAAMIIESLKLFYHIKCFRCSVCQVQLGNGSCGADVRVRNHKLHCQNCYSNDEAGLKFSKV